MTMMPLIANSNTHHTACVAAPNKRLRSFSHLPALATVGLLTLLAAPSAQAAVNCLALPAGTTRLQEAAAWSAPKNYYDVPVGEALTGKIMRLNTRIQKTGSTREDVYVNAYLGDLTSNPWLEAPISGVELYANVGLGLRITIWDSINGGEQVVPYHRVGSVNSGLQVFTAPTTVTHQQFVYFEVVRTRDRLPDGTRWSLGSTTIFGKSLAIFMRSNTSTIGGLTTNCDTASVVYFQDLGSIPAIPVNPPPPPPPPVTCTVNNNNTLAVKFEHAVLASTLHTVGARPDGFNRQEVVIRYACQNAANNPPYTMSWLGTASPHAPALATNKTGVGIKLETENGTVIPLNTGTFGTPNAGVPGGSSTRVYAYPTRTTSATIGAGEFKATATLRINMN